MPASPPQLSGFIAFSSDRVDNSEIYLQSGSDNATIRLTISEGQDTQPAWSPDGTRLAFTTDRDGNKEVYLMNADGTALVNLTNDPGEDQYPTWSLDGEWIAFSSNRDGNQEIYITRLDGSLSDQPYPEPGGGLQTYLVLWWVTSRTGDRFHFKS